MELEQIYNELHAYWEKQPESKKTYSNWHYGDNGVKQAVEGLQNVENKPSLDLKVARILKDMLDMGCLGEELCTNEELNVLELWMHEIFIKNND